MTPNKYRLREVLISLAVLILAATYLAVFEGCKKDEPQPSTSESARPASSKPHALTIEGVVTFTKPVENAQVKAVLDAAFRDYVNLEFKSVGAASEYSGKIDSTIQMQLATFKAGDSIVEADEFFRFKQYCTVNSFYYKVDCPQVEIVDAAGRSFEYTSPLEALNVSVIQLPQARELAIKNQVNVIMVDLIMYDRLGKNHLHKFVRF